MAGVCPLVIQRIPVSRIDPARYSLGVDSLPDDVESERLGHSPETFGGVEPLVWNRRSRTVRRARTRSARTLRPYAIHVRQGSHVSRTSNTPVSHSGIVRSLSRTAMTHSFRRCPVSRTRRGRPPLPLPNDSRDLCPEDAPAKRDGTVQSRTNPPTRRNKYLRSFFSRIAHPKSDRTGGRTNSPRK